MVLPMQEMGVQSLGQEDTLEEEMETLSRIPSVLGNPTDRVAWWAIAIGSQKSWPQLSTHTHN